MQNKTEGNLGLTLSTGYSPKDFRITASDQRVVMTINGIIDVDTEDPWYVDEQQSCFPI